METSQKNAKKGFKFGAHVSKYITALDPTKCSFIDCVGV